MDEEEVEPKDYVGSFENGSPKQKEDIPDNSNHGSQSIEEREHLSLLDDHESSDDDMVIEDYLEQYDPPNEVWNNDDNNFDEVSLEHEHICDDHNPHPDYDGIWLGSLPSA